MITRKEIKHALDVVFKQDERSNQIIQTLNLYLERGELENSVESAIDCLELAGYVVRGRGERNDL